MKHCIITWLPAIGMVATLAFASLAHADNHRDYRSYFNEPVEA